VTQLIFRNLAAGKSAQWFIRSTGVHSFTYTPDAAKATALLGNTNDAYGQVWHLPTDNTKITVTEFAGMIASELKVKPNIRAIPLFIIRMLGLFIPVMKEMPEMVYQYDRDYFFDSSKFERRFGIKPTPYREGIKEMCSAYSYIGQKSAA
jgi:nucleoside-diphosphate-sugar epimerase